MAIAFNAHPFRSPDQSSLSKIPSNVHRSTMQAAAAHPAPAPAPAQPPPRRHRVYTAVDPRCEWARTDDADTLVVDVSGFRKEELKVLYNTSRKLKIAGERQDDGNGSARWARFLKSFPVPRSVDTGAIRAIMDKDEAVLYVILPKGSPSPLPPPPSSMDKQKEQQPEPGSSLPLPHREHKGGTGSAGDSSGNSNGSFWSAQEDAENNRIGDSSMEPEEAKEKRKEEEIATQDVPRPDGGGDANAVKKDGEDGDGKNKRWWKKIRPLDVLGLALILALVGVGAWVLYVMLL